MSMAAVVSHAMRRFPLTQPDVYSYDLRGENSCQAWSPLEGAESALARSMRYATPWLYGSVRAPVLLTPAFVLCTCSDYLNGTKRSSKKSPSVCKKCKGTRLSLSEGAKFGTVRCYPTTHTPISTPLKAGTVRVSSTTSRPSILPSADPYDLMRRSRLSTPENGEYRARSMSPKGKSLESRSYSASRVQNGGDKGRKSILECDINPYELLSSSDSDVQDATIKRVGGQRIRVKPPSIDSDYEDIPRVQKTISSPKLQIRKGVKAVKDKHVESSRFKSILKKPNASFSDTDDTDRSPSPGGSQFYLPLPKKKVQFLVENKSERLDRKEDKHVEYENVRQQKEESGSGSSSDEDTKKKCSLRRSISERINQEPIRVTFHDTMALRGRTRSDSRITFTGADLQRLDGINPEKGSPTRKNKLRRAPPPPPLKEASPEVQNDKEIQTEDPSVKEEEKVEVVTEPISEDPPSVPPRKRSNNKSPVQIIPVVMTPEADPVPKYSPNKTIVRISPVEPVHKIQIKNEFIESPSIDPVLISDSRKTSILINGDDCYCTVNVSDDVPLYQSSVVVKDAGQSNVIPKKSSTIYITGNFSTSFEPDNKEESQIEETKEAKEEVKTETHKAVVVCNEESIEDILKDPVEAVRRNLVPHVCGKSDESRTTTQDTNSLFYSKSLLDNPEQLKESLLQLANQEDDGCSEHSSSTQYELVDPGSDCYTDNSNRSSVTEEELANRTKFYELLADAALVEVAENEDHHYESIKINADPIYEEIEVPPPLPANPPPTNLLDDLQLDKEFTTRSIFEGASKYDILSYLVDAKERGIVPEDSYTFPSMDDAKDAYNRVSHMSTVSDSSEDSSLIMHSLNEGTFQKNAEIERNDSGVGSETSKSSLSKYRNKEAAVTCEDCEATLDSFTENEPLLCRKCVKKRSERKEIIMEIVETEEKYSRDLQIILEEFYQPMLVAGLLTPDQLSAIFLNVEELLENSQALAERLRDAVEIAAEQGDEDLQTVNIGKLFLEASPMLHAFETYCVRQGAASLLLASLEKDKELLRIFLRVSQMENTLLRRMNLNSFLMVPVQRVTKYPLLLARLHKVTPVHHETREQLKEAQSKIELHLNHMNSETKDVPSKLWRRISSNSGRRPSTEMDLVNIKLRKIAVDVLEWNHEEAKFTLEGRLLYTQPTDNNWRKGRTIKLAPINALLVTNGKANRGERSDENNLVFPKQSGVREAALLLVRDKNGRYSLLREPLYLDRCVIAADPAWQSYFEVQEVLGKDTFIFKAEDDELTRTWYRQLQHHAQGLGTWRKRRNALANIMINGMGLRS